MPKKSKSPKNTKKVNRSHNITELLQNGDDPLKRFNNKLKPLHYCTSNNAGVQTQISDDMDGILRSTKLVFSSQESIDNKSNRQSRNKTRKSLQVIEIPVAKRCADYDPPGVMTNHFSYASEEESSPEVSQSKIMSNYYKQASRQKL